MLMEEEAGVALGGGEEQQPELVAGLEAGGDETPVVGDRRLRLGLERQGQERGEGREEHGRQAARREGPGAQTTRIAPAGRVLRG